MPIVSTDRDGYFFGRLLGAKFDALPEPIRSMHAVSSLSASEGRCTVIRGRNPIARLIAALLRLPLDCPETRIQVYMHRHGAGEAWERRIATRSFVSRFRGLDGPHVVETIGPVAFHFELLADASGLSMVLRGVRVFGIAWPERLWPRISARETVVDGKFRFDVTAALPSIGLVVAYHGTLTPVASTGVAMPGRPIVLFDGICKFCNWGVNFLLRWDSRGVIRFAAMQSEPGLRLLRSNDLSETDHETIYVLDGDRVLSKSEAILHLNRYLAWPWRGGLVLALIPRKVRDGLYDLIARNRYKLMGVRRSCRVPTGDERERFLT